MELEVAISEDAEVLVELEVTISEDVEALMELEVTISEDVEVLVVILAAVGVLAELYVLVIMDELVAVGVWISKTVSSVVKPFRPVYVEVCTTVVVYVPVHA